ncbi:MAG: glycosyltransferase family 2 protein [Candidatus Levybacteria bacterium]|nr:glycosyltransferase family 2 protein [Candidatus Levybacteria bacterium]
MINHKPLVSILLPVHNCERFLADCLKSLVGQSYRQIEIIAIDDFSTDSSLKILKSFAKKYPTTGSGRGKKVRVYRNIKRYGIVITLNRLLRRAKGDYIAFMDAKDISSRQRIKKQVEFISGNPGVVAVGAQCRFINDKGRLIGKSFFPKENQFVYKSPLHGITMQFETLMVNKNLMPKDLLKFSDSTEPFIYSDLFIKLLPYGKFANLDEYLHYHRKNPKEYFYDLRNNIISFIKLWLLSKSNYNYKPSLISLLIPFTKVSTR